VFPTQKTIELPVEQQPVYSGDGETHSEAEEVEDYSAILNDASLRLEQGNLYKMVMNSDLFANSGYDEKAVANVTREIRNFAKERMEIMLGMRQEPSKEASFPAGAFPFNALEVEVLKMLASTATKGASQEAEPFSPSLAPTPRKNTVNAISLKGPSRPQQQQAKPVARPLQKSPAAPVKRPNVSEAVQRILEEEGVTLEQINQVFDPNKKYLTPDEMASLTAEQMTERNRQIALRAGKSVPSQGALPMPSQEHMESLYTVQAHRAEAHPQMQMIMNAINNKK
jgi:pyruvate/2-oxoglutarate dehydrogenase complex dihydrolipoamide acyltransferase (E2) component